MANPKDFVLLSDGFSFKGQQFRDDDIAHIVFELVRTTVKTNFVSTGEIDTAELVLHLTNGKKIDIYSKSGFAPLVLYFKDKPEERMEITQVYQKIASRTFKRRLQYYLSQIEANGYFVYDKCRFYPKEKIVIGNNEHIIKDISWSKNPTYIYLNKKNPGLLDKVSKGWNGGPHFCTDLDKDVIFFLLDHMFGVRW